MFCQNKINSKLKQKTSDERLNPWRPKISCKPAQNCEVFALKFPSFVHKIVPHYLSVVQVLLSFAAHQPFIVFC